MKRITMYLIMAVMVVGCNKQESPTAEGPVKRITALEGLAAARKVVPEKDWQLASLSNTGVIGDTVSIAPSMGDQLMTPDGKAGGWVAEFFKDAPTPVSEGGHTGVSYPMRRVAVSAEKADELPGEDVGVPKRLVGIHPSDVESVADATTLAESQVTKKYDVLSVASWVNSSGTCEWMFRFYDLKTQDIVAKVAVSGDGKRVVPWN